MPTLPQTVELYVQREVFMSLVGYQRSLVQRGAIKCFANHLASLADEVVEAIKAFDAEQSLRQQQMDVAVSASGKGAVGNTIRSDNPVFVLSRAFINLVTNFGVLALVAGACVGLRSDRVLIIFDSAFPKLSGLLRRAGIDSAPDLVYCLSFGLTLVGLLFSLSMAFSCFQEVSSVIRNRWLQALFWLASASSIIVVSVVLMAFVIGLSSSLA